MTLKFIPIELDRQKDYQIRYRKAQIPASDYTFVNLWGWSAEYQLEWAWTDQVTWIRQNKPETRYWAPMGEWQAVDWQKEISLLPEGANQFVRVPQKLIRIWQEVLGDRIEIEETRGQWDYLYAIEELVQLKGNRFHKKKNLVNQFKKKYDYRYLPFNREMIERVHSLQKDWCLWKDCEANDTLAMENRVIEKVLNHAPELNRLIGGALMVEDKLVSYTIAEVVFNSYLIIHFEKGNPDYKGSYQAINQMFLVQSDHNCIHVNREQDIDDPGLRKAKLSYHPVDFIKKNSVHLKE